MLPSFMAKPFTRKRFPMAKDHGTLVVDRTGTPNLLTCYGSIQPGTGTEDTINRDGAEIVKTIWAQPGSDVHHQDVITIDGLDYYVNGEPDVWDVGVLDHIVIRLSRWTG
jgi:hypothetical protein